MYSFQTPYSLSDLGEEMLPFTSFWVGLKPAAHTDFVQELSKAITFLVLGPIPVKFHIRTLLIESFPTIFQLWWCAEEKLHFTPVHTLRQLKRDEALFPPLGRIVEFRARYHQLPVREFWGLGKLGGHATYILAALSV